VNAILFGAGASYGVGDIVPERPPLGNQLFAELARCFRGSWGALPSEVALLFAENFEKGMALLWERFSPSVPALMQHMAIYFVQLRPRSPGATLYCRLVRAIEAAGARERVLLSTLNYECLLEHSIWHASVPVNYGDFPNRDGITVWKLHGACNLLPEGIAATRGVSFSSGVGFGTAIRPAKDLNEVLEFCLGDNSLPPVMCLFMPGKPIQVSAGSISAVQAAWREKVLTADRVAVVGVFPNVEDTHVWDTLAKVPGELVYVGAAEPFEKWVAEYRSGRPARLLAERFDAAFDSLVNLVVN
jgi:hypothetical protein